MVMYGCLGEGGLVAAVITGKVGWLRQSLPSGVTGISEWEINRIMYNQKLIFRAG